MAAIQENTDSRNKPGKRRAKKLSLHIDMTPMVDLAFLLLTFFVLTAVFTKLKSMQLTMPDSHGAPTAIKNGITFLLASNNRIFYYEGEFREKSDAEGNKTQLTELSFGKQGEASLHKYLLTKNNTMHEQLRRLALQNEYNTLSDTAFKRLTKKIRENREAYTYLIKTDNNATYANVVGVLNELNKNLVGKYFIEDIAETEKKLLTEKTGATN